MTQPIRSQHQPVSHQANLDREMHAALVDSKMTQGETPPSKKVTAYGPGFEQTKKSQGSGIQSLLDYDNREGGSKAIVTEYGLHKAVHAGVHGLRGAGAAGAAKALQAGGIVATTVMATKSVVKASIAVREHAEGQGAALHAGNLRDAQKRAIAQLASEALPASYQKDVAHSTRRAAPVTKAMYEALTAKKDSPEIREMAAEAREGAAMGRSVAQGLEIHSQEKLNQLLGQDAHLKETYRSDTAFRLGVDSYVKDAQNES